MKSRELERRLARAVAQTAPNDLEEILSRCEPQKGTVIPMKKRTIRMGKSMIAACLALVFLLGGGGVFYQQSLAVASVVSLDVNPSIELTVNTREKVLSCTGLNADAEQVLSDMAGGADLKGAKLNVAVNAIVGALVSHGYLEDISSAILISVESKNQDQAVRLRQELTASVDTVLQNSAIQASVLSQTVPQDAQLTQQAHENHISTGKAALISRVMALNSDLQFAELSSLSVKELKDLAEIGAPAMPIGRDRAAEIALIQSKLGMYNSTSWEVDAELDDDIPHYEVELWGGGGSAEIKVHAFTGEILTSAKPATPVASPGSVSNVPVPPAAPSATEAADDDIGKDNALKAALDHAGLQQPAVTGLEIEREWDDGRLEYEIDFRSGSMEYDYTVDGRTGSILHYEREPGQDVRPTQPAVIPSEAATSKPAELPAIKPSTDSVISAEQAKAAALSHAGIAESQVREMQVEPDRDDGRLEYDVEFKAGGMEYEYTIDGVTGTVLEHEIDRDD